jgi:hypothetical protein
MATAAEPLVPILTALGGAALGAAASWRKAKPEAEGLAVTTLKSVIEQLRLELDRKEEEIGDMRAKLDKLDHNLNLLVDLPPGHLS